MSGPLRLHKLSSRALPLFQEGLLISADIRALIMVIKFLQLQGIDRNDYYPGFDSRIPVGALGLVLVRPHRGIRQLHDQKAAQHSLSSIQHSLYS